MKIVMAQKMATKRPLQSREIWATIIYGLAEFLPQLYADPMFQEMMSEQMTWIRPVYMITMIYLRLFKTSTPIFAPKPEAKEKPKLSPIDKALREEAEDMGMF